MADSNRISTAPNRDDEDGDPPRSVGGDAEDRQSIIAAPPNPDTLDRRRTIARNNSSDSYYPPPTPEVDFLDDVDVISDGSIVFNTSPINFDSNNPPSPTRQQLLNARKDRFPSFDSMASSGSVVHKRGAAQPPALPKPAASNDPEILPYHRRKQQRQQQQQKDQDDTPPRPEKHLQASSSVHEPSHMEPPPHQFFPQFVHPQGAPPQPFFPPYPPPQHFGYPPTGQPPQNFPFPPPGMPPPGMPPPGMAPPYGYPPYPPPPQEMQQIQHHQQMQLQQHHHGKSYKKEKKSPSNRTRRNPLPPKSRRDRIDSFDSSQEMDAPKAAAPPRPHRRPTPPPPPPPPAPVHVRNDSMGSVSSLGSIDRSGKDEKPGFFDRLNPWHSPRSKVDEFHRKNQEFLSRVDRPTEQFSPISVQRRVPLTSLDRPPPSMGNHRRLNSIENDDWTETDDEDAAQDEPVAIEPQTTDKRGGKKKYSRPSHPSGRSDSRRIHREPPQQYPSERTSLLPPPGISSNEYADVHGGYSGQSSGDSSLLMDRNPIDNNRMTERMDNTTAMALYQYELERAERSRARKKKRKKEKRKKKRQARRQIDESSGSSSSSESSVDFGKWVQDRAPFLEQERERFIEKWKREARDELKSKSWVNQFGNTFGESLGRVSNQVTSKLTYLESFFANLPLTIGAIALSTANLGVDWFKFCEENLSTCQPVHFHSKQCTFPEFPGCFYCDTSVDAFKIAEYFHFGCSCFAGMLALSFVAKLLVARRVVFDELSSPTTASPAGLLCMTLNIVFAGRGMLGMIVVTTASCVHLCLAIWFIYTALAYNIMPEPSWFPNTTGIGISAVKTWLYHPMAGHFLMAISLTLNFFLFPISLIRVFSNKKISATVGWMQMSAPDVSLYALTIMAQPSFEEENPDINSFQRMHRLIYLPCMHFLFGLCILGMLASVTSLYTRWSDFKRLPFSPAHAAFCCPCLSHANAIQAYRAAVNSFSGLPSDSLFLDGLYVYWVFVLLVGSCVTLYIGTRFLSSLPKWTHLDLEGEIEPPAPYETEIARSNMVVSGDAVFQSFVSPAILQANETGTLVLTRDAQGRRNYRRTRKTTALGFEPIMNVIEMEHERSLLLEWVSTNAPRRRNRTLSVPGIDFSYGAGFGTGNSGVYDMEPGQLMPNVRRGIGRSRSNTLSPRVSRARSFDRMR